MRSSVSLSACFALWLAACGGKGVTDSTVVVPPTDTSSHGTVQRTSLAVHVTVDPADAAIASTVGISVSGLSVRLTKAGSSDAPLVATTNAAGDVMFTGLLDGQYTASVERVLTANELTRLPLSDREAATFAGGVTTAVSPPNTPSATLSLVAARRGGLVISEMLGYYGYPIPYNWGTYVEIYNNSDTTAYLDGMYLAFDSWGIKHTDSYADCNAPSYDVIRRDTTHLWVSAGIRFPGAGRDYPIAPGKAVVYAQDALDHTTASGSGDFPNLSRADFEHVATSSDTDNPTSANVASAFNIGTGTNGRGMRVVGPASWLLIANLPDAEIIRLELSPLKPGPTGGVPRSNPVFYGIPKARVLDVFSVDYSPSYKAYLATTTFTYVACTPWLPDVFERSPSEIFDDTYRPGAIRRRTLGITGDGREVLMRTRTSSRDLEVTTNLLSRSLARSR